MKKSYVIDADAYTLDPVNEQLEDISRLIK